MMQHYQKPHSAASDLELHCFSLLSVGILSPGKMVIQCMFPVMNKIFQLLFVSENTL